MVDVSVNIKVETIDNGLLATGSLNPEEDSIRCFYGDANDLIESVTYQLKEQIKQLKHFSGVPPFTLKIIAYDEDDHAK